MPLRKTRDLTGPALDLAVARALALPVIEEHGDVVWDGEPPAWFVELLDLQLDGGRFDTPAWCPSTDVSLGMRLIWYRKLATFADGDSWCAAVPGRRYTPETGYIDASREDCIPGDTPLEAGCRALAFMTLGENVDLPASLADPA